METTDPKEISNEQAEAQQEDFPENGNESITEGETDSGDLKAESLDDEDDDL